MNIIIRKTNKNEFFQTEYLTRETFWNLYSSGCVEHFMLHNLRESTAFVEELDLVLLSDSKIVGHIISTKAKVVKDDREYEVLQVGPVSIHKDFQNNGLGSQLLNRSIEIAKEMNFRGMILFGNPDYYKRFGFKNAKAYNISTSEGLNFDAFMALELQQDGLMNISGKFFINEASEIDEKQLEKFDEQFPVKEKKAPKLI